MSLIQKHLNKNNLHHAYLIEGSDSGIVAEIKEFLKSLDINTLGNPDFCHLTIDNFKIDEAFDLRAMSANKSFSSEKKIFIICANNFSLDAQNVLLKMFEEPIENTHFFLVVPDTNALLKTLISRFYLISTKQDLIEEIKEAEKFIALPLKSRIDFIKELLTEVDEEDLGAELPSGSSAPQKDSARSKSLKFLNALEVTLHNKFVKNFSGLLQPSAGTFPGQNSLQICLQHFLKVREFLRMPGSSTKSLLESVAMITPNFKN